MKWTILFVVYTKKEDWGYTTQVVELPGCISYWTDIEDAQKMTKEAILAYLNSLDKHKTQESLPAKKQSTFISNIFIDDLVYA